MVRHAVVSRAPFPGLEAVTDEGVALWESIADAYRASIGSCFDRDATQPLCSFESMIDGVLKSRRPDDAKVREITKRISGSLLVVNWSVLSALLANPVLGERGVTLLKEAKAESYYAALEVDEAAAVAELLEDPEIQKLKDTERAQTARDKARQLNEE